jgi:hypothetical protein
LPNNNDSSNNNPNSIQQHLGGQRQQQEATAPRLSRHQISLALLHQPVTKVQTKRLTDNQALYVKKVKFKVKVW